jgi:multidrug efflux pump
VATTLLTLGLALAGVVAFFQLPVSPLPQVDFPTITVQAALPGASPETMAASVAIPLERRLGQIANVTEMTSTSSQGSSRIVLQFGLDRDINGAARDVQAAINAARTDLPVSLRSNPTYRKVNPADAPILVLALTSDTRSTPQLYDAAATVLQPKLSQVAGVGQATIGGGSPPAVRVEVNPNALFHAGITLADIRAALAAANANAPKGVIEEGERRYQIESNDRALRAEDYASLIIAYRNGAPVRLTDIAQVTDSVEDTRHVGLANGKPAVLIIIYRQPGANIIETVDRVKALLPQLANDVPSDIDIMVAADRTSTIRAALRAAEVALLIAIVLVVVVVLVFLRDVHAAWIPAVAVPVSLIGTFAAMYLLGFSLNNLTLIALIIATGFVVDDAVVVVENISRHREAGLPPMEAAIIGAREVGFTVFSMSVSLVAVFIPVLFMGGILGRLFHEFAVTITIAIAISLFISLTTTPMMSARLLRAPAAIPPNTLLEVCHRAFTATAKLYDRSLGWALRHPRLVAASLIAVIALSVHLYIILPKGFFPQQDTGRLIASVRADQNTSFAVMRETMQQISDIIRADPAVRTVVGFTGGGQTNSGFFFISLDDARPRDVSSEAVLGRLRGRFASFPPAVVTLLAVQDFRAGGRPTGAQFQYTLLGDDRLELKTWATRLADALKEVPEVVDVDTDQQDRGLESVLTVDRETAARLGVTMRQISDALYDAFGQRQVSTIYADRNQYSVVLEVAPEFRQSPDAVRDIHVGAFSGIVSGTQQTSGASSMLAPGTGSDANATPAGNVARAANAAAEAARNQRQNRIGTAARGGGSTGSPVSTTAATMVPIGALATVGLGSAPITVTHQGQFVATTLSFNLPEGGSLSEAVAAIKRTMVEIGTPATIAGGFQGTAKIFQDSVKNQPLLILAALVTVYLVLGILYESFAHPLTILSTIPSAGAGATLALLVSGSEFSLMALIGVILLIGIVKKNAIMMVDFALATERRLGCSPEEAIREACRQRLRPILMTTMAALFGALALILETGLGGELRRPLGITIVGGLIVSQMLTLYTTPVVYLYVDRLRRRQWRKPVAVLAPGE